MYQLIGIQYRKLEDKHFFFFATVLHKKVHALCIMDYGTC